MSVEAMAWVLNHAPLPSPHLLPVLISLANFAHDDGAAAFPSQAMIAYQTRKSDRAVRNDLEALQKAGLIKLGDQRMVMHLPADRRPVVYDLQMQLQRDEEPPARRPRSGRTARPAGDAAEDALETATGNGRKHTSTRFIESDSDRSDPENGRNQSSGRSGPGGSGVPNGRKSTSDNPSVEPSLKDSPPSDTATYDRGRASSEEGENISPGIPTTSAGDSPALQTLIADIRRLQPGWSTAAIRDALVTAATDRDPAAVAAAAIAIASGDHGATRGSFRNRLCSDGPWWDQTARTADRHRLETDRRRQAAPECPRHRGQRIGFCSGCAGDEKARDDSPEPSAGLDTENSDTDARRIAREIAAAAAARPVPGRHAGPVVPDRQRPPQAVASTVVA